MSATAGTPRGNLSPTLGLPRMHMEAGDRRDFLPDLVAAADRAGAGSIVLEHGYGRAWGWPPTTTGPSLAQGSLRRLRGGAHERRDVIRCPSESAVRSIPKTPCS